MISDINLFITIYMINIVLYFITFTWIVMLEKNKCACSMNWKRDFIKYYLIFMVTFMILYTLFVIFLQKYVYLLENAKYIIFILQLLYIGIVFVYIRDLITNKCECSDMIHRDITQIYNTLDIISIILSLLFFIIIAITKTS